MSVDRQFIKDQHRAQVASWRRDLGDRVTSYSVSHSCYLIYTPTPSPSRSMGE